MKLSAIVLALGGSALFAQLVDGIRVSDLKEVTSFAALLLVLGATIYERQQQQKANVEQARAYVAAIDAHTAATQEHSKAIERLGALIESHLRDDHHRRNT